MNTLPLLFITFMIILGIYDFYVVYVNPEGNRWKNGSRNVDRSISRFLQGWPSKLPFGILVVGIIMGHTWGWMPCPPCPEDKPCVPETQTESLPEPANDAP